MGQNQAVKDHLYDDKPLKCVISMEPFTMPVVIMKKKAKLDCDGNQSIPTRYTYDAKGLIEALNQTWATYHLKLAENYLGECSPISLDLNDEFIIVPNRLLGAINDKEMPSLPKRGPGPAFDEKKLVGLSQTGVLDKEDGTLQHNGTLKRFLKDGIFSGIAANRWMISSHGKHYQFVNCQFNECIFSYICWCQIRFTACQFVNCTFVECGPMAASHTMLNNEYKSCSVVSRLNENFKKVLVGTQTAGIEASMKAALGIQLTN